MSSDAYRKAVDLLARRTHFERELDRKLADRGFEESERGEAMARLRELGYLDDRRAAEEWVRSRQRRGPVGRRKLFADLLRRGADEDAARAALDALAADDEGDLVRQAAERWKARGGCDPASLARHLERRGFSGGDILRAVRELRLEDPTA